MKDRKICVITGTRAEFGLLKPVMEKIRCSENLLLQVIATGMHLLPEYGDTLQEIIRSGFTIDAQVPMVVGGDTKNAMAISIGVGVIGITQALSDLEPDVVLVLGDRYETFAGAIAGAYSGRYVAHINGGDSPHGGYDEYTRHAITKISHIHFPATELSAERIKKMGENPEYIFSVGSTALDTILYENIPGPEELGERYGIDLGRRYALLIYHPVSTNPDHAGKEIKCILDALQQYQIPTIAIYPNTDPGGKRVIQGIEFFKVEHPEFLRAFRSLPFEDYLGFMRSAAVIIGNSSSAIIEAPSFHIPVINVGVRQEGRERAGNVINVACSTAEIIRALDRAFLDQEFHRQVENCVNPYGDGHASEQIVQILSSLHLDDTLLRKKISY